MPRSVIVSEVGHTAIMDLVNMTKKMTTQYEGREVTYVMSYEDELSRHLLLEPLPSKHAAGVKHNIFQLINLKCIFL